MRMGFEHDIGIVALGERFHRLCNECRVALVEKSAVSIVRVDHAPLIGVVEFTITKPHETCEVLPIACRFYSRIFQIECAEHFVVPICRICRSGP